MTRRSIYFFVPYKIRAVLSICIIRDRSVPNPFMPLFLLLTRTGTFTYYGHPMIMRDNDTQIEIDRDETAQSEKPSERPYSSGEGVYHARESPLIRAFIQSPAGCARQTKKPR